MQIYWRVGAIKEEALSSAARGPPAKQLSLKKPVSGNHTKPKYGREGNKATWMKADGGAPKYPRQNHYIGLVLKLPNFLFIFQKVPVERSCRIRTSDKNKIK